MRTIKQALEEWYQNLFGDDFYLELQRHEVKNPSIRADRRIYDFEERDNAVLIRMAKEYGIKLVATNDVLFTNEEDAEVHDRIICESLGRNYDDNNRSFFTKQEWLKRNLWDVIMMTITDHFLLSKNG